MTRKLIIAQNNTDLERCYPVLNELRPKLSFDDFLSLYIQSHIRDEYELIAIEENSKILAVMGYRILFDFVRGKHVYIDDLVATQTARSKGLGTELLKYAEKIAKENNCKCLRLCTGLDNERGMKFYDNNGWIKKALAYTKVI